MCKFLLNIKRKIIMIYVLSMKSGMDRARKEHEEEEKRIELYLKE